jgi:hypothetical protein
MPVRCHVNSIFTLYTADATFARFFRAILGGSRAPWRHKTRLACSIFRFEVLTDVCQHLDLCALVGVAQACKRLRHGDSWVESVDLPTRSPVVPALCTHTFTGGELIPRTRPIGCSESWIAYLARGARQRRFREAPIAVGVQHSLFVDSAGRLLACGKGEGVGQGGGAEVVYPVPVPVAGMAGLRVRRSVAAGNHYGLALGWDGRVYSWGENSDGQLGRGEDGELYGNLAPPKLVDGRTPQLVEGLELVCGIAAASDHTVSP